MEGDMEIEDIDYIDDEAEYEDDRDDEYVRRLTRHERHERMADNGCDTWEEYHNER